MKSYGVRKTLAILLSVVLALPLFVFAAFADDPVFTQLPVYSDSVESGQTWYNRSQLKSDTANANYDSATIYLSEDGNTLKIVYTANAETVTELHTRAEEPAYFAYICVLPEFGDPLPTSPDGLSDGDYWFDKDGLVELVRSYGMQEDYMYFYTDATYRLSVDGTILRKSVTLAGTTYTTHSDEFLANQSTMSRFLHQVGVDPNAGFTLLPTSDEGLEYGDYWFDVETLAAALSEESAQLYRSAQFYLSEDGSTLRMVTAALTQDYDKEEYGFFFTYLHQVGEDETKAYLTINVPDEPVCNGDTVQVTVDLEQNPGLVGVLLSLNYDPAVLTLTNVQGAGMMTVGNLTPGNDLSARPYNILWDDGTVHTNHTETGTILTLTFTVKDTAAAGSTAITLTYAADSTFNVDLQDVALHISDAALAIVRHTPGDADGDGEVSGMDITVLSRYLAEGWDVTVDARNSDVNGDGELDLRDVVLIRRFLAGGWGVELV